MIKAGIIGGAGYTGGELIRILLQHPGCELAFVHSQSHAGKPLHEAHPDLLPMTDMPFSADFSNEADVLFLCLRHGEAAPFLDRNAVPENVRIIDLSQDFRVGAADFVYGLPELNHSRIAESRRVANPGCFATAIQLALLPLARAGRLRGDVHVHAITGSTGAGQSPTATTHFSWRHGNVSVYRPFRHQHLREMQHHLTRAGGHEFRLHFIPMRGSFTRGIFATCYLRCELSQDEALALYRDTYAGHPFVAISERPLDVKQVVNTNFCFLHLEKHGDTLLITSVIDNLLKGASGQAVQNMNLQFGLEETAGLMLKAAGF